MQEENTHRNKLEIMGQLTASLVHEIRNSLSALKMNLDYLQLMTKELPEDANDSISLSVDAAERINELVTNLLRFSKKEDREHSVNLNDEVIEAIKLVAFKARNKGVEVFPEFTHKLPPVNISKNKLLQILINLIINSIEASNKNSIIRVKTYLKNEASIPKVVCEVEDNGSGIAEENKEKIFNEFYTNKTEGTGLGLHVCSVIAKEFDAQLDFKSKLGEGTRFFIKFKIVESEL